MPGHLYPNLILKKKLGNFSTVLKTHISTFPFVSVASVAQQEAQNKAATTQPDLELSQRQKVCRDE